MRVARFKLPELGRPCLNQCAMRTALRQKRNLGCSISSAVCLPVTRPLSPRSHWSPFPMSVLFRREPMGQAIRRVGTRPICRDPRWNPNTTRPAWTDASCLSRFGTTLKNLNRRFLRRLGFTASPICLTTDRFRTLHDGLSTNSPAMRTPNYCLSALTHLSRPIAPSPN